MSPLSSPPFRTTKVSFDPGVLPAPVSYRYGRYPTQTTNAVGHVETVVYDPVLGKVVSRTGPNGIQTRYTYDPLGRQTAETDRSNSAAPLTTTTQYFLTLKNSITCDRQDTPEYCDTPFGFSPPSSRVVVVTTPPTSTPTWSYSDDQGKATGSLAYAFDGGFIETTTQYNPLGQITSVAKPFHLSAVTDQVTPAYTQTTYDEFHRVDTVVDPLGTIDATGTPRSTTLITTYDGSTVQTQRVVNGGTQIRKETKNAIGKVASVTTQTETGPSTISYWYDADGDLTLTAGPEVCVGVGVYLAALNSYAAIQSGAAWDQTVLNASIGLGIGLAIGAAGQAAGLNAWQGLVLGSASAAVSTGVANVMSGHDFFGWNILGSAMMSAATGAASLGLQKIASVSQASAEAAQGGGGSGEQRLEKIEGTLVACNGDCPLPPDAADLAAEGKAAGEAADRASDIEDTRSAIGREAEGRVGEKDYGLNAQHRLSNGYVVGSGKWKCNCFVYDVEEAAGAKTAMNTANQWADPGRPIRGWVVVGCGSFGTTESWDEA